MTDVAGGIQVRLEGDSSSLTRATNEALAQFDKLKKSVNDSAQASSYASNAYGIAGGKLDELRAKALSAGRAMSSYAAEAKQSAQSSSSMGEAWMTAGGKADGLAGPLSGLKKTLKDSAGGMAIVAQTAGAAGGPIASMAGGFAGLMTSASPLTLALAAVGAAAAYTGKMLEDQAADAAKLDEAWHRITDAAKDTRDAASAASLDLDQRTQIEAMKTGDNPSSDAVTELQMQAQFKGIALAKERAAVEAQIVDLQKKMANVYDEKIRPQQENDLAALKAKNAALLTAENSTMKQFEVAPKLGEELERQARAAKARAVAEEAAQRAIEGQATALARRIDASMNGEQNVNASQSRTYNALGPSGLQQQISAEDNGAKLAGEGPNDYHAPMTVGANENTDALTAAGTPFRQLQLQVSDATVSVADLAAEFDDSTTTVHDWGDELSTSFQAAFTSAQGISDMAKAIAAGQGGQAAGSAAGGALGSAAGAALTGGSPIGGAAGGAIGTLIGTVLGKALDQLIDSLKIVTPLMDAVAVEIAALQPILLVVGELFRALADETEQLAPLLLQLARPTAALLLVFVRIIEAMLPFVDMAIAFVTGLAEVLDFLVMGVDWLDQHFFRPLASGAAHLYNGFVDLINTLIIWARTLTGNDKLGVLLDHANESYQSVTSQFADSMDDLKNMGKNVEKGAAAGTKAGMSSWSEQTQNMPSGYKALAGDEYAASDAEAMHSKNGTTIINIETFASSGTVSKDIQALRNIARNGNLGRGISRRGMDDDKN